MAVCRAAQSPGLRRLGGMLIHASAAPQIFRNWVGWRQEIMWKGSGRVGTWGTAIAIKDAQIANARLVLLIDSAPVSQLRPSMRDQRSPVVACPDRKSTRLNSSH